MWFTCGARPWESTAGGDAMSNELACVLYVLGGGFGCSNCSLWLKGGEGCLHGPVVCPKGKWCVSFECGEFCLIERSADNDAMAGGLAVAQEVHVLVQLL